MLARAELNFTWYSRVSAITSFFQEQLQCVTSLNKTIQGYLLQTFAVQSKTHPLASASRENIKNKSLGYNFELLFSLD